MRRMVRLRKTGGTRKTARASRIEIGLARCDNGISFHGVNAHRSLPIAASLACLLATTACSKDHTEAAAGEKPTASSVTIATASVRGAPKSPPFQQPPAKPDPTLPGQADGDLEVKDVHFTDG